MDIERLIKDNPKFALHEGTLMSWAPHPETIRFLYRILAPGMSTLETGCGQTTVIFSIAGTQHICVTPKGDEVERVKTYCAGLRLPENVTFLIESSDKILPCNDRIPALDHVFIDGAHGFPAPILDWHFTAHKLKLGGILAVDDVKMPSVRLLYDFLCGEEEWELVKVLHNTAFFKKLGEPKQLEHWSGQKINATYLG